MVVNVVQNIEVEIEQYYVIRGVKVMKNGKKVVVAEQEMTNIPSLDAIGKFLYLHPEVNFISTEVNYRRLNYEV